VSSSTIPDSQPGPIAMNHVEVYGADHSPWVQAVLLGLHDAGISHSLTTLPPFETFRNSGVMMPAASFDEGPWQLESADILRELGFSAVTDQQMKLIRSAWRGVLHRADSAALFWGGFSLMGDRDAPPVRRLINDFLRSFVTLYFYLLIRTAVLTARPRDPENFGDQFLPFESMLEESGTPYLAGDQPDTLDFLLFGIIQCHCSIYVPPVAALQSDPRLAKLRGWIARMQERFSNYDHLYSGAYFAPHSRLPAWASPLERIMFWLGAAVMIAAFPITVPLVAFLAIRNRKLR
jgi:glutathione S-transferase